MGNLPNTGCGSDRSSGFPYPENIALCSKLESIVRANGAVPASIGILNGVAKVGFEPKALDELLSSTGQRDPVKVSRRDLAMICGRVSQREAESRQCRDRLIKYRVSLVASSMEELQSLEQ